MLVDSHCHLDRIDLAPFGGGLEGVLKAAVANGVTRLLSVAVDLESWPALARMSEPYPQIALSVGVHPSEEGGRAPTVAELVALGREPRVVAIGETGLDYYYGADSVDRQQDWFRVHIAAARELGKPLIVHTRAAREDTLRILAEEGAAEAGGVLHCFTEDWAMAEQALALNFHISFSGIVTFKNAKPIQDAARRVPADRLLVETDSPYLAPAPHRGKPNHPAWVRHVAEFVARLRGESLEQVAAVTTANYLRLFGPSSPASLPPAGEGSERGAA
ncbi:MAG: TatD family hydrolase [Candidatus Contendobacter sp.]